MPAAATTPTGRRRRPGDTVDCGSASVPAAPTLIGATMPNMAVTLTGAPMHAGTAMPTVASMPMAVPAPARR